MSHSSQVEPNSLQPLFQLASIRLGSVAHTHTHTHTLFSLFPTHLYAVSSCANLSSVSPFPTPGLAKAYVRLLAPIETELFSPRPVRERGRRLRRISESIAGRATDQSTYEYNQSIVSSAVLCILRYKTNIFRWIDRLVLHRDRERHYGAGSGCK